MGRLLSRMLLAVLAVASSGVALAAADDGPACSASTLHGRYVFSASGFTVDPATGAPQPKAIIEAIEFDGDGNLAVPNATRSVNGTISRTLPSVGTYTVTESCAGTITFAGPTFDILLSPGGNQFWLIQTNPNSVFEGSATRTSRERGNDESR